MESPKKLSLIKSTVEFVLSSIEEKAEKSNSFAIEECGLNHNLKALKFLIFRQLFLADSEDLLVLEDILGDIVEDSIDILDNSKVKLYRSQHSGRELFEITSEEGNIFRLFPKIPSCTCDQFFTEVLQEKEFVCAHYLATRIASALGKVEVIEKTGEEFKNILKLISLN